MLTFTAVQSSPPKQECPRAFVGQFSDSKGPAFPSDLFHGYLNMYSDLHVLKFSVLKDDAEWKKTSLPLAEMPAVVTVP